MHEYVNRIKAVLPYEPPNIPAKYLRINLDLDKLTILVGPNASGKTAVLESIGYMISSLLEATYSALGLALTTTFRPRTFMPSPIAGTINLNKSHIISSLYIESSHPLIFETKIKTKIMEMMQFILNTEVNNILYEIEKDIGLGFLVLEEILKKPSILMPSDEREKVYRILAELIIDTIGRDIDIAASYSPRQRLFFNTQDERIKYILRYRPIRVKMLYNIEPNHNHINKTLIIENIRGTIVMKRRHPKIIIRYPRIIVFHPGFIYRRGVFESLYNAYVYEGLPGERESIYLLKKYIEWIDGYELIHRTLHVKTINGRRVPVYNLSDGQRIAVFMGLLYAITKPPVLFLIDTPEAFVHPDGLSIMADLITDLVARGNQVIVATQSIEFLTELLIKANQYDVINHTSVQRIALTREGLVRPRGKWSGKISLESIEKLGADLRR